ncbi:MAG: hypothetical protein JW880_05475 [Candidatus Thermoplasmatota archaeon]|nr:hypothetical protein [Candidatus Thermoplasmatota archaeon]
MWKAGEGWLGFVTAVVLLASLGIALAPESEEPRRYSITFIEGSMFISDAGSSHGGFEMTVEYSLNISPTRGDVIYAGDTVLLEIKYEIGLGDPIESHELEMRMDYDPFTDEVILQMTKTRLRFAYVEQDLVWGRQYDDYYIASWGGDAPQEEIKGNIGPVFFGLPSHYYVEMRLDVVITPVL